MATIARTRPYLLSLKSLIESEEVLKRNGYIVQPLTDEELLLKRRCTQCGKAASQLHRKKLWETNNSQRPTQSHEMNDAPTTTPTPLPDKTKPKPNFPCRYHSGRAVAKRWTCCNQPLPAKPCGGSDDHKFQTYLPGQLEVLYQFHHHNPSRGSDIRDAVAIDCEMGTAVSGDSELIRISAIDYFSNEILMDNYVEPAVPMAHLNTRYSGVTWTDIRNAKRDRTCINGKDRARRALCRYVGPDTVVIGHGASSDLRALMLIHTCVVDSMLIEYLPEKRREAQERKKAPATENSENKQDDQITSGVEGNAGAELAENNNDGQNETVGATPTEPKPKQSRPGRFALKTLVKERVGRDIQLKGKLGHDSLEDAIGARDLVHWYITHPEWNEKQPIAAE